MAQDDSPKSFPLFWLVVLALFGVYTVPKAVSPDRTSGSGRDGDLSASAAGAHPGEAANGQAGADLVNLLKTSTGLTREPGTSVSELLKPLKEQVGDCRCVIATIPDPTRSLAGYRFDEFITAIQRAVESQGYVLDRYTIPWLEPAAAPKDGGREVQVSMPAALPSRPSASDHNSSANKGSPPAKTEPGLIIFRPTTASGTHSRLLLVFLVPETVAGGIDKDALAGALDWTKALASAPYEFHILGPTFSGSQFSLRTALKAWRASGPAADKAPHTFMVISGSAAAVKKGWLESELAPGAGTEITFNATRHRDELIQHVVRQFLDEPGEKGASKKTQGATIAMLVESGTGFGQLVGPSKQNPPKHPLTYYHFPVNIARLRNSLAKKSNDAASNPVIRSAERLELGSGGVDHTPDLIEPKRPEVSTPTDELVLNETMIDLARLDPDFVGIVATDTLDTIFLAQRVRQFVPDAKLFTTSIDLEFTHPQWIADLRGMIVASSYPLYAQNQGWSFSYKEPQSRTLFASDDAQGVYNAMVAHLDGLKVGSSPPRFLEYGVPFDLVGIKQGEKDHVQARTRVPPVWISVVGNHGIYPVRAAVPPNSDDPQATQDPWKSDSEYILPAKPGADLINEFKDTEPSSILEPFRLSLRAGWLFVLALLGLFSLAQAGIAFWYLGVATLPKDVQSDLKPPWSWIVFPRLSEFVNATTVGSARSECNYCGAGLYLFVSLVVSSLVFWETAEPFYSAVQVPWFALGTSDWELWLLTVIMSFVQLSLFGGAVAALIAVFLDNTDPKSKEAQRSPSTGTAKQDWRGRITCLVILVVVLIAFAGSIFMISRRKPVTDPSKWPSVTERQIDVVLRFERSMSLPSGVAFLFPLLGISVASATWVGSRLLARHVFEKFTGAGKIELVNADKIVGARTWNAAINARKEYVDSVCFQARYLLQLSSLLIVPWAIHFLLPIVWEGLAFEEFEQRVSLLFGLFFLLLLCHWLRLWMLWKKLHTLLELIAKVPLLHAMDRLPPGVARWFFEAWPNDRRFEAIERQARVLAQRFGVVSQAPGSAPSRDVGEGGRPGDVAAGTSTAIANPDTPDPAAARQPEPPIFNELERLFHDANLDAEWAAIKGRWAGTRDKLWSVTSTGLPDALKDVRMILLTWWQSQSVTTTYAEAPDPSTGKTGGGETEGLRAIAMALANQQVPAQTPDRQLPAWIREAEDLLGLVTVHWLTAAFAQIWVSIGFLVLGSLSVLLAVSSYPFRLQSHMLNGLGILIVLVAAIVGWIVFALNRDELISRVANKAPNKLQVNRQLLANVFTYIVPLLGALAALSFDASDTLRGILDPVLRHLH